MPNPLHGWTDTTLGELCDPKIGLQTGPFGSQLHASDYTEFGIPVIMPKDIVDARVSVADIARIPEAIASTLSRHRLIQGDIVFGRRGDIGRCALITQNEVGWICGTGCLRARISSGNALPDYVMMYLGTPEAIGWLQTNAVGQTMLNLNTSILAELPIPLPPLAEQRQIAAILSTWDEAITLTTRLIAALQRRKQALMQLLLTGAVRFPGFEDEWEEYALENLGDTYSGLSGKSKEDFGSGKPYIPYKNIFQNSAVDQTWMDYVNVREDEKQNRVVKGDIFFTVSSETPDEVGMSSVLLDDIGECYLNSFCFGFRLHNFSKLTPQYARFLLRSAHFRKSIFELAQGSTRYNLSKRELLKVTFNLPAVAEQNRIADLLTSLDTFITSQNELCTALQTQKRGLMQQLLTGAVRVPLA